MKILITGGNSYIARNIEPLLEQMGHIVIAPSHEEFDLLYRQQVIDCIHNQSFDAIIHTAAIGGSRHKTDTFDEAYLKNIQMFENLCSAIDGMNIPVIIFGSGAEYDRRTSIQELPEAEIYRRWPIDPYGLAKNIITRRANDFEKMYVFRLFSCFNHNEPTTRFIRSSIFNLKRGFPIEIYQNRMMDFFYLDDVVTVIDHILKNGGPGQINLVYNQKIDLLGIASLIHKYVGIFEPTVVVHLTGDGPSYTGCADTLYKLSIVSNLIGLEDGIRRTCNKLL